MGRTWDNEKALHFREIVRKFCGGKEMREDESIMLTYRCLAKVF